MSNYLDFLIEIKQALETGQYDYAAELVGDLIAEINGEGNDEEHDHD